MQQLGRRYAGDFEVSSHPRYMYLDWEWAYGPSSQGLDEADATEFAGRAE